MSVIYTQASFKNSRVASRKPTTEASTSFVTIAASGNGFIAPSKITRTYITIKNTSNTEVLRYGYSNSPTLINDGFELKPNEAADLESPSEIWGVNVTGNNAITIRIDEGRG